MNINNDKNTDCRHNEWFDTIVRRRGSGSMKWDAAADDDVIPMWVADMDFVAAPAIRRPCGAAWSTASMVMSRYPTATTMP